MIEKTLQIFSYIMIGIFGWLVIYGIIRLIFAIVKVFRKGIVRSVKESLGGHWFYHPEEKNSFWVGFLIGMLFGALMFIYLMMGGEWSTWIPGGYGGR